MSGLGTLNEHLGRFEHGPTVSTRSMDLIFWHPIIDPCLLVHGHGHCRSHSKSRGCVLFGYSFQVGLKGETKRNPMHMFFVCLGGGPEFEDKLVLTYYAPYMFFPIEPKEKVPAISAFRPKRHHLVQILQHLAPIDAKCFWPIARNEIFSTLAETYWEHHSRSEVFACLLFRVWSPKTCGFSFWFPL